MNTHPETSHRGLRLLAVLAALLVTLSAGTTPASAFEAGAPTTGTVTVVRLNVRSAPAMTGSVIGTLPQNATVTIVATSEDGDWYQVQVSGMSEAGWVFADYIAAGDAPSADAAAAAAPPAEGSAPTAQVTSPRINVRSGPGTTYAIVGNASAGEQLPVTGISADNRWFQVQLPGATEPAWVFAALTTFTGSLAEVPQVAAPAGATNAPVAAVAAAPAIAAPAAPAAAPNTGTGFGYGITTNMWQGDKQGTANLINQMGFNWAKQQVRWEYAEPTPGAIQWQEMDDIVNAMNGNGINLMFSVVTSPGWTRPNKGGTGGPPEDFQQFANFLGAVAGRYCGRLQAIEVWNEQNLQREWEGYPLNPPAIWICSSVPTMPSKAPVRRHW